MVLLLSAAARLQRLAAAQPRGGRPVLAVRPSENPSSACSPCKRLWKPQHLLPNDLSIRGQSVLLAALIRNTSLWGSPAQHMHAHVAMYCIVIIGEQKALSFALLPV